MPKKTRKNLDNGPTRTTGRLRQQTNRYLPEIPKKPTHSDKPKKKQQKKEDDIINPSGINMVIKNRPSNSSSSSSSSTSSSSSQKVDIILKEKPRKYKPLNTIKKPSAKRPNDKEITGFNWGKKINQDKKTRAKRREIYSIMSDPIKYKEHIKKTIQFNMLILGTTFNINDTNTLKLFIRGCVLNNKCNIDCINNIKAITIGTISYPNGILDLSNETILDHFVDIVYITITHN